jgi:hypothetical protein
VVSQQLHRHRREAGAAWLVADTAGLVGFGRNGQHSLVEVEPAPLHAQDLVTTKARQEE